MRTTHRLPAPRTSLAWMALGAAVLLISVLTLSACGGEGSSDAVHETPDATASSDQGDEGSDVIAPIRSQSNGASSAASGTPGPVRFDLPAGWQEHPPASSMRTAQALIPGPGGVAEMAVFYFGPGGGGGTEANLQRWIGQMQVDEGTEPERGSFQVGDLQVTHVTVHGILLPSNMGTGPTEPQPNSMLLGAVVEGPGGPWFFKVTGPAATLEGERDTFLDMLRSVRPPA